MEHEDGGDGHGYQHVGAFNHSIRAWWMFCNNIFCHVFLVKYTTWTIIRFTSKGSVDESGQPHGRGTLYFQSGDRFEGKFKHGNKHGKGCFYFEDGSILQGGFVDDAISGTGVYTFPDRSYMVGSYTDGDLNGLVEEFYANCKRQSKAFYTDNTRTGVVYHFDEYGSCLFGKVNNEGQLSGHDIAYVYPDKETSLIGRFKVYAIHINIY